MNLNDKVFYWFVKPTQLLLAKTRSLLRRGRSFEQ